MDLVEGWWQTTSEKLKNRKADLISRTDELLHQTSQTLLTTHTRLTSVVAPTLERAFARQQDLSRKLKESLNLNIKIFILIFLIFGFQRYRDTEAPDISLMFFIVALLAYIIQRISSAAAPPALFYQENDWNSNLLKQCPQLTALYNPPLFWGWNGHIQTMVLGKMGRSINPILPKTRHSYTVEDGATVYYDVFESPFSRAKATLIIIPGIANTSDKLYIKTFVRYALTANFRVVVMNHLGALKGYTITSPRIFGYGHTDDMDKLVTIVRHRYSCEPMILLGFSMGANIITKFLTEKPERQGLFLGAVSVCQGYDIHKSDQYLRGWARLARMYNWAITNGALKSTVNAQGKVLYPIYNKADVSRASCVQDIDNVIMSKMYGFANVAEMYKSWSCSQYLDNLDMPMLFLNAIDDPIISPECLEIPIKVSQTKDKVITVQTQCGGHLGFYTGGWLLPDGFSWLDTAVVQFCDAIFNTAKETESQCSTSTN